MDHISQIDTYSDTIRIPNHPGAPSHVVQSLNYLPSQGVERMRSHWVIAALLSSALAVGCNGRNNDNSHNTDQNQANAPGTTDQAVAPAPPVETQPQPYSTADNSAV